MNINITENERQHLLGALRVAMPIAATCVGYDQFETELDELVIKLESAPTGVLEP